MIYGWSLLLLLSAAIYCGFILWCQRMWSRHRSDGSEYAAVLPDVSVIIPVRNEEDTIARTVECIALQEYPAGRFELIIVDDGSTDRTAAVTKQVAARFPRLRCTVLALDNGGSKKAAIEAGVRAAKGDWILATDGDTYFGSRWMQGMLQPSLLPGVRLICGPVIVVHKDRGSIAARAARVESVGLTAIAAAGIAAGTPFFCNGANMAYEKAHFAGLNGFTAGADRLSGDDTELLLRTAPVAITYRASQDVIVRTEAPRSVREFLSQRQRWASKIPVSLSFNTCFFAFMAWLCHALLLFSLTGFFGWMIPSIVWTVKAVVEVALLKVSGRSLGESVSVPLILLLQPFYALAVLLIGVTAVAMPYRWKGRTGH